MALSYQFNHDLEAVFELLTDPNFLVDRSLELGDLSAECEVEEDGEITLVRMTREIERQLPGFAAKIISGNQMLRIEERWQSAGDSVSGSYTATIDGQPMTLSAKFSLDATDTGCVYSVEHRAKVKIPLIGGRLEKYIASQLGIEVTKELDYVSNALA